MNDTMLQDYAPMREQSAATFLAGLLVAGTAGALAGRLILGAYGGNGIWYMIRSTGTVAYLLLSASTLWGLILSTRIVREFVPGAPALAMHSALSWLAVFTGAGHAVLLLFDRYYDYTALNILAPFTGPYRPLWVGFGSIGLYLALLTSLSFQWRRWLGVGRWRMLHKLTFVAYAFVTLHGLLAGSDSGLPGMRILYAGSALLVLLLTNYRLLTRNAKA